MTNFDVCIIGAGPAGYKAAMILAKNGKNVVLIDKDERRIGGTCLNEGCIPAKNYLESSNYVGKFSYFTNRGLKGSFEGFDISLLKTKTDDLLDTLRNGLQKKLSLSGVSFEYGKAAFISKYEVKVNDKVIKADKFIIATGSIHKEHPVLKVDGRCVISSKEVFELESLPEEILIIGAGAIGCEFANFFNFSGSNVHLCEFTPSILPLEDSDVSSTVQREYKKQGIKVDVSINAKTYEIKDKKITVTFEKNGKTFDQTYDKVLISIGRVPNTKEIGLEKAGVKTDERGFIEIDSNYKTTNEHIYAVGDIVATPSLAHVASYEAKKVSFDILGLNPLKDSVVPNVIFTTPQVGSVGENEKSLKTKGILYSIKKLFLKSLAMPKIKGDDSGFVKLLFDENDKLIGASMVGYDMTEVVNQAAVCINSKLEKNDILSMIFAHPTMSESFYKTLEI
jgi:dihydrolipoamide dehydrogenase